MSRRHRFLTQVDDDEDDAEAADAAQRGGLAACSAGTKAAKHKPMKKQLLVAAALSAVAVVSGCNLFPTGPVACTDLAAFSASVTVKDASNDAVIDDATVTFSADGAAAEACDNLGEGNYACGLEVEGELVITASKTGFSDEEGAVTVEKDEDGCHVVGQQLTLVLAPQTP